ncbi:MAG: hypothetical protein BGN95_09680 [Sphingomonas sp. 66-10]|uniref:hypothetical protein n=1 Tax=Sphingomonas sp. 66-10 TaxID=1895848 RepID=UPI00092970D2|nr:hypothetical protein [Sphingomonas sp. 66-10]OJU22384.1 MAG: hypothetical protein BGN95_09680 [Sphingomonas sp. 66-10]
MEHVLTVGQDGSAFDRLVALLWKAGFRSIFRVDDLDEARSLLQSFRPRLILALPDAVAGRSDRELCNISSRGEVPVVALDRNPLAAIEGLRSSLDRDQGPVPGSYLAFAA